MVSDKKYVKVIFEDISGADSSYKYKIDEINVANNWNPRGTNPKKMGGFSFSVEDKIIRWLVRGDTIYDVIIPEDAEIIKVSEDKGVFRANKIIISNAKRVTDDMAMELYNKSTIPENEYYKAIAGCCVRGYMNTAKKIFEDKVNNDNISIVVKEFLDFCGSKEYVLKICEMLNIQNMEEVWEKF